MRALKKSISIFSMPFYAMSKAYTGFKSLIRSTFCLIGLQRVKSLPSHFLTFSVVSRIDRVVLYNGAHHHTYLKATFKNGQFKC